jgi:cephalosporin hydroxylase
MTEPDKEPAVPATDRVVLAYVVSDTVSYSWHRSLMGLVAFDSNLHGRLSAPGGFLAVKYGTGGLIDARNQAVHEFLEDYEADWLFWVDTDMGFGPDTLELLLGAADPKARPIVGALCFSQREDEPDGLGGWRVQATPVIYDWITLADQSGYAVRWDYPRDTVTPCHATGSACVVIHRSVLERMREEFHTWYDRVPNPSTRQLLGEDLSFCVRAGALDIPVHVDTRVKTSHHKRLWLGDEQYIRERFVLAALDAPGAPALSVHIDIPASLESLERSEHVHPSGMLKLGTDLDRYRSIIEASKPEVLVETGTLHGVSARWFADEGVDVITVDVTAVMVPIAYRDRVTQVQGDSADPDVAAHVAELVAGRRCMVSLDSDHSGPHVAEEIKLYSPLVSPGCYLVVEDGIFGYATRTLRTAHGLGEMVGSPLDAIAEHLDGNPDWSRDVAVERAFKTSHHPAGFWLKVAADA